MPSKLSLIKKKNVLIPLDKQKIKIKNSLVTYKSITWLILLSHESVRNSFETVFYNYIVQFREGGHK